MDFEKEKKEFLEKRDKSRIGAVDTKIKKLVEVINSTDEFFTTSSCSGRIIILALHPSGRKDKTKWLFSTHERSSFEKIKSILNNLPKNDVWFSMEPSILHIASKNLASAKKLLNIARDIGFRRSGIISAGKNRLSLELISTEKIYTIIGKNSRLLAPKSYLKVLIETANEKLEKTWKKIDKFSNELNKTCSKINYSFPELEYQEKYSNYDNYVK